MIIIGAGASGMFASGTTSMLGSKTLLLDLTNNNTNSNSNNINNNNVGGDCTNYACVPSKAVRSEARMKNDFLSAQQHAALTVSKVKIRESPSAIVERNPNLDLMLISDCEFVSPYQIQVTFPCEFFSSVRSLELESIPKNTTTITLSSKKFLIATGASPIVPESIRIQASEYNLPIFTYRTVFQPTSDNSLWNLLAEKNNPNIVIAGGGATALEIGQSLARLGKGKLKISMVAPDILKDEHDINLRNAAIQILEFEGIELHLNKYLRDVLPDKSIRLSDGTILPPPDALIMCIGRNPNIQTLQLEKANIAYDDKTGILVKNSLRSKTNRRVFACGDCCSAVTGNQRTATQAAWTGYHAASNTIIPYLLRVGSKSFHRTVPRVIYTDPELVLVGLSQVDCERKYGLEGFDSIYVPENNTDRADMEYQERLTNGFVEIRATKFYGRILGFTGCGPTASELANEMSLAIVNGLTVRDIAKSLHSYPSHGYLMYRAALALTMSSPFGQLEALGPVGGIIANVGRFVSSGVSTIKKVHKSSNRRTKSSPETEK
ncbi:MAG: pyruvate/2-oxoglutarate dehydrogenase complex dihydrolipoamide dehydrogenase (E3) component [Bacillariaceae sp.]|jgi:pyruvate/2-oxoglutarate dehydrogenase complex dihydrolipoamide dehydrogenase (E3) component